MSEETKKSSNSSGGLLITLVLLVATFAVFGFYYFKDQKALKDQLAQQQELLLKLTGLQNPVVNKMDPAYTDADGDLIADAPTDPKKLIDPDELTFSYVAVEDNTEYKAAFADLMTELSKATGKKVRYLELTSTEDQLHALKVGELNITALNTGNVPVGVCNAGFVPVSDLGDEKGGSTYEMEILVKASSPILTVGDLKGRELTLTEIGSNSGHKAPLVTIKNQFNLLPGKDFAVRYSQSHSNSIKGLADGTFEAIAVANDVLKREIAAGTIKPEQFRSIYKSEHFPTAAMGYAYNLKPELAEKIRKVLVEYKWKGTSLEKHFASSNQTCFVPVNYKNDWALIRQIDNNFGTSYMVK